MVAKIFAYAVTKTEFAVFIQMFGTLFVVIVLEINSFVWMRLNFSYKIVDLKKKRKKGKQRNHSVKRV